MMLTINRIRTLAFNINIKLKNTQQNPNKSPH